MIRKSLAGSLQLLTGAVFTLIVVTLVIYYSVFSSIFSYDDRIGSSKNYGSTLASLLARPISLGDYAPVEQSLRDSALPDFICGVHIFTPSGKTIAATENEGSKLCRAPKEVTSLDFRIHAAGSLDIDGTKDQGRVVLSVEMDDLHILTRRSVIFALVAGAVILCILLFFNRLAVDWALMPLSRAVAAAASSQKPGDEQANGPLAAAPREIQPLLEKLTDLYRAHAKAEGDIRVGKVARQVAHDIRSPLAALEMGSISKNVPEAERIIIRQATNRIRDIANDLRGRFREAPTALSIQGDLNSGQAPQLLPILIDEIVTQMRLQYRQRGGVEITANLDDSNYGLFAVVEPSKFRRVLSNLIQNAVEAIPESGSVTIRSESIDEKVIIEIADTGTGIPENILPLLGDRGATFGKSGGTGLGLHNAKEMVEIWNGSLQINSILGKGSIIRMTLPVATAPEWFVPRIVLQKRSHLVVLDDDQSIHQIWNERFSPWTVKEMLTLSHFTSASELRQWFAANSAIAHQAKYLVDFELIGESVTGLSLVQELGIESRSILVTSHYDESDVRLPCEQNKIRLIPKGLAAFVPICIEEKNIDVVLIDDDMLTHQTWNLVAAQAGRRVLTVARESDLAGHVFSFDTPVYVDRHLADEARGEDILQRLHQQGFVKLYLFTGDTLSDDERAEISFVSGIVGKSIPAEVYGRA